MEELDQLILSQPEVWLPQPGPQTLAYYSEADDLFYGGAAGGGKTDLVLGLAATEHLHSCIFRREYPQLDAIVERSQEIYSSIGRFYASPGKFFWRLYGGRKRVEFRAIEQVKDSKKYQGRPHDLKAYDEITHFNKFQFVFTKAWNRSVYSNQRCRVVATGNPPTDADGRWVMEYWSPWLDDKYPYPATPGELRWFISADNREFEVEGKGKFRFKGQVYESRSRTFIPSTLRDNLYLADTGYSATLDGLPEPLRSQLLYGDFQAGVEDDPWQILPTDWIKAAQARWRERRKPSTPMSQLGVDVARGGSDKTVFTPRYDNYFDTQATYPGVSTNDGMKVAQLAISLSAGGSPIVGIDAIGVGSSPVDFMKVNNLKVLALVSSKGSSARSKSGQLGFVNLRAEMWWKLRESLDPDGGDDLAIPDDPELLADLAAPKWSLTVRGIKVEEKDKIKERLSHSPDKGESLVYAHANPVIPHRGLLDYMEDQYTQHQSEMSHREIR